MRKYPDLFSEAGIEKKVVLEKINATFDTMFLTPIKEFTLNRATTWVICWTQAITMPVRRA